MSSEPMQVEDTIVYPAIMVPHEAQMFMKILDPLAETSGICKSGVQMEKNAMLPTLHTHPSKSKSTGDDMMEAGVPP